MMNEKFNVLDHGYVMLVDVMGSDAEIARAARVSYLKQPKEEPTAERDAKLIEYLMKNRHCYHPDMEVLTLDGWKKWSDCSEIETFLVPDPDTKTYKPETLAVEKFDCDEMLQCYSNSRMSFKVTSDHRMWFATKYQTTFKIHRAGSMPRWGHFDPSAGYRLIPNSCLPDPKGCLIGFILGDGCWINHNVEFHLVKKRKIEYLEGILYELGIDYQANWCKCHVDGYKYCIPKTELVRAGVFDYLLPQKTQDKALLKMPAEHSMLIGILEGLINSDGHVSTERLGQINFASSSPKLAKLFETLSALCGYDAHEVTLGHSLTSVNSYKPGRTTLEARKQYFYTERYKGKVYCATTSTGLLAVRGNNTSFGFICGNTSPFEMAEFKFEIKMPIFVARQWVRHRTASLNEVSGRYSELPEEYYVPDIFAINKQDTKNKQGRGEFMVLEEAIKVRELIDESCKASFEIYKHLLSLGVARELARVVLPLSTYTTIVWKMDLHNLLHFLKLRLDPHAQLEIRAYAKVIEKMVAEFFPATYKAWVAWS